jgi:hypothetical protein
MVYEPGVQQVPTSVQRGRTALHVFVLSNDDAVSLAEHEDSTTPIVSERVAHLLAHGGQLAVNTPQGSQRVIEFF